MSSINTGKNHTFKPVPGRPLVYTAGGGLGPGNNHGPAIVDLKNPSKPRSSRRRRPSRWTVTTSPSESPTTVTAPRLLRRGRRHGRGPDLGHHRSAGADDHRPHRQSGDPVLALRDRVTRRAAARDRRRGVRRPRVPHGPVAYRSRVDLRHQQPGATDRSVELRCQAGRRRYDRSLSSAGSSRGASRTDSTGCPTLGTLPSPGSRVAGASSTSTTRWPRRGRLLPGRGLGGLLRLLARRPPLHQRLDARAWTSSRSPV